MAQVAVIGGGLMGAGIAQVFAQCGHQVSVFEPQEVVRRSIIERVANNCRLVGTDPACVAQISIAEELNRAVEHADFVTEAAPERLELKQSIFAELERAAPPGAILASNTSVIPIGRIMGQLATAHRMIGTHWWNPPYLVPLVEVIQGPLTSDDTVQATINLLAAVGKKPAHVKKDVPGFVANRLQHALWREAIAMVADGVCDAATLDQCVKNSFGLRLAVLGPLENADLVGLDLTLDIHRTIMPELNRLDGPHPFLEAKVAEGRLGFKTGAGFRTWTPDEMADLRAQLVAHLVKVEGSRSAT